MKNIYLISGRCSGKTAFIRSNLKSGYMVVKNSLFARLYYVDNDNQTITLEEEARKDNNPIRYKELIKLGKKIKKNK